MSNQFERFSFHPYILEAIEKRGFKKPTDIQERVITAALKGTSIIGQSQTGTGKTHAYLLPIMQQLEPEREEVQAVITAPTRELAKQIYQEALKIAECFPEDKQVNIRCYVGGTDKQRSIEKLKQQPHLIIGTPARIKDLMDAKALQVYTATTLVVDEADLMLDMGFIQEVDFIAARMTEKLQMLVFSATIPEKLKPFLQKYMENPRYVQVDPKHITAQKIEHVLIPSRHRNKTKLLYDVVTAYNPYLAIIFTNTKQMADTVADDLMKKGLHVGRLHGNLSPRERRKMMKQINDLEFQYVVATDLAARGIDIEGVSHVINYEIPADLDFYIHRAGRTGRAGYSGIAATIYELADEDALNKLEKMGVSFVNRDLVNGEWVESDDRNKRKNRKKQKEELDVKGKAIIAQKKKVKPGYKKKKQYELEAHKKRQRRIEAKARKKK